MIYLAVASVMAFDGRGEVPNYFPGWYFSVCSPPLLERGRKTFADLSATTRDA